MSLRFELYTGDTRGVTPSQRPNTAYLKADNWDDYGFKTAFALVIFDNNGTKQDWCLSPWVV